MYKKTINVRATALALSFVAISAVAQPAENPAPNYVQVKPGTTLNLANPFGLIARKTTCAELASNLQRTTWSPTSDGGYIYGILYDIQWNGYVKAINSCSNPNDTIENLDVVFVPSNLGEPNATAMRELLSELASRATAKGSEWTTVYKDTNSPSVPRVTVYKSNASVNMWMGRDRVFVEFRSYELSQSRQIEIKRASVRPLGVAVGVSTCFEANNELEGRASLRRLERSMNVLGKQTIFSTDTIEVKAKDPGRFYPGASSIVAECRNLEEKVETLYVGVKDGPKSTAAIDAYRVLASKYKRVDGSPIPGKGAGYARFETSGISIEIEVWGNGQDFLITYMETAMFNKLKKSADQKRQSL